MALRSTPYDNRRTNAMPPFAKEYKWQIIGVVVVVVILLVFIFA